MEHDIQFYRENVLTPLNDCRNDFTENIWEAYENRKVDNLLEKMSDRHGYDLVATLISIHIKRNSWDGRYSRDVKSWAESYQTSLPIDGIPESVLSRETSLNTHAVIVNVCAQTLIEKAKEFQSIDNSEKKNERKPTAVEELYDKMNSSQNAFRERILNVSDRQDILQNAYEFVVREDILMSIESGEVSENVAKELLKCSDPIGEIFEKYQNTESSYMDEIRQAIRNKARDIADKETDLEKR